ncbi:DUF2892 domain-containing protein [Marichromatium gracile]|uniref:DUF2892 family protein n=1 Tax=Marichromatium gracile TaxID=1048 RepID=A0A4R4AGX4_MARGR|nr:MULTISPECIES: DUF2892 domain-containing protein [Marichromatium]MBO8087017.1 DUF2892 domain-containing protein [Marichromatium sp.]KXX63962.1 hypothetical protein AY586_15305 [Marichromatium gracile]MBK1708379.1 DUF2892 domain-containing protein [Marichromatium gracile]MCF1182262.1 DUF2892 domain-containing protein [Marichromatium gracile]RNE89521.1 DUF2892 domain-containing protein [Marichromatium sp. AB31]
MNLPKNVGKTDRNFRLAAGGVLVLGGIASGSWIPSAIGLVVLATGFLGTCLAYVPFHINTCKEGEE